MSAKTKIVCTLGPSSNSVTEITKLVQAGMDIARLNFSHGDYKSHLSILKNVRKVERKLKKRIPVIQDLQGPKIRIADFKEKEIKVKKGDRIILTADLETNLKKQTLKVDYKNFYKDVKKDNPVLIEDGLIELKVEKKQSKKIYCKVVHGGIIKARKGVNLPDSPLSASTITEKDLKDLKFGLKHNYDFIALSFVKNAQDIKDLRKLIKKGKRNCKIISKIERKEAVENIEEIIKESDGVMVARGDLGINLKPELVPIIQKKIIKLSNHYAKPVITATQVLHSMIENPIATRAEISDAANSIYDHTDAIMLSNESAVGKYPAKATRTLNQVAKTVECEIEKEPETHSHGHFRKKEDAICINACELAHDLKVDHFIIYTEDGYTAKQISSHRSYANIITVTESEETARELKLYWGITDVIVKKIKNKKTEKIIELAKKNHLVCEGDKVLTLCNASKKAIISSTTI